MERRLAAILAADAAGYSRMMEADEAGTLARLKAHMADVIEPVVASHHGHVFKTTGDGLLAEFASVIKAVACAVEIQRSMGERNRNEPDHEQVRFRIGINIGDIVSEGGDIFGDGVNVAARLQQLAEPGGICIHADVKNHVRNEANVTFVDMGEVAVKSIARPLHVYRVALDGRDAARTSKASNPTARKWVAIAAACLVALLIAAGAAWTFRDRLAGTVGDGAPAQATDGAPSIAVLPFTNLSDDQSQDYFADGMADDLITDLSKVSNLLVVSRHSTFTYKGRNVAIAEVVRDLGVRYVLEGSVRRVTDRLRINVRLIDGATGGDLWAERYEGGSDDLFALQDKVVGRIVEVLSLQLTGAEKAQIAQIPTRNLEAYDKYLRAETERSHLGDPARLHRSLAYYAEAVELDPKFADAYAGYAQASVDIWRLDFSNLQLGAIARRNAYDAASKALAIDPQNAPAYSALAIIQSTDSRHEEAIESARKVVSLRPGAANGFISLAEVLAYAGRLEDAQAAAREAFRLNPKPTSNFLAVRGHIDFLDRRYREAVASLEVARALTPGSDLIAELLAATYALDGQGAKANLAREHVMRRYPVSNLAYYRALYSHYQRPHDLEHLLQGLERAGFPQWPYDFRGDPSARIAGDDIKPVVFGKSWTGTLYRGGAFVQENTREGRFAYRSENSFLTGEIWVAGDLLCSRSESAFFGRPLCGMLYRVAGTGADTPNFAFVGPDAVKLFSLKE